MALPGILTNKHIHKILTADERLADYVRPENIKVMVLSQPTNFPFISIKRIALETSYTKDCAIEDLVTVEIIVVDNVYSREIEIAQLIRDILDYKVYRDDEDNILFTEIRFFDCLEDTNDDGDVYVQSMTFQIKVQNIEIRN